MLEDKNPLNTQNTPLQFYEEPEATFSMNPKKFMLWLFIVSIVMIFASLTSAYIVRQSENGWLVFELPQMLWYSSGIIILSSITVQWAYFAAKKDNLKQIKVAMLATVLLGFAFLVTQWLGWGELVESGIFFGGIDRAGNSVNPSGSFVYVLMGVHAMHLVTGLVFLLIVLRAAYRYEIHSQAINRIEMCSTYWHFLDILWIYLFVFLLMNR
jgi:cytochrome c oxidase subunit III